MERHQTKSKKLSKDTLIKRYKTNIENLNNVIIQQELQQRFLVTQLIKIRTELCKGYTNIEQRLNNINTCNNMINNILSDNNYKKYHTLKDLSTVSIRKVCRETLKE